MQSLPFIPVFLQDMPVKIIEAEFAASSGGKQGLQKNSLVSSRYRRWTLFSRLTDLPFFA